MLKDFRRDWQSIFDRHQVDVIEVHDDPHRPTIRAHSCRYYDGGMPKESTGSFPVPEGDIPGEWREVIFNQTDSVRNLGFLYALKSRGKHLNVIITLDDDVRPWRGNDPIQEHLNVLKEQMPISWMETGTHSFRGVPYGIHKEAPVWFSHGVWEGVYDWDAPTQLVSIRAESGPVGFHTCVIPKGVLFPCCGMNVAFRAEALPYVYYAPMGPSVGVHRFGDIWMGVFMKRELDALNKAVVTGYSTVHHTRASNVFKNLQAEAKGIEWNEEFWKDDPKLSLEALAYFEMYEKKRERWKEIVQGLLQGREE